ncbi:MAG TPA: cysteine desulfurase NifS, partial [Candidatus Saccharicenans sp.]|nr:cysteine desulfurase NifS [Candidatus Saccharicenans sp.]
GSACTEGSGEVSHVLLALGLSQEEASSALRLSLGRFNTEQDIDQTLAELPGVIDDLRREFGS